MAAFDHIDGVDLHIAQVLHAARVAPGPSPNGADSSSLWARSKYLWRGI